MIHLDCEILFIYLCAIFISDQRKNLRDFHFMHII